MLPQLVAHYCITTKKETGGAYGFPAVLLLFSVVDALSNYAGYPEHSFQLLKDIFPALGDSHVKQLANWYRHLPAHQAIIMPGTALSVEIPGDPIELNAAGEPTHIRLLPFWDAISNYWQTKVTKLAPVYRQERAPKSPATINVVAPSASGTKI